MALIQHFSRTQQIKRVKKQPHLKVIDETPISWKPHLTYFHCILHRDSETPAKQTFDYVQWALDYLNKKGLFKGFKNLKLWSDGCGKHFKCYNAHFFMSTFQESLGVNLTWDFLAPNRAHNKADSAAAYLKGAITRHVKNYYLLSQVTHLAFACSRLKNTFVIEANFKEFPEVEDAVPESPFMRQSFSFKYQPHTLEIVNCKHNCKDKKKCTHKCCTHPPTRKTATLEILQRDGNTHLFKLIGRENREEGEFEPLQENAFWGSLDRQAVLTPSSEVRLSQTQTDEDWDYDFSTDDPSYLSESEYEDS